MDVSDASYNLLAGYHGNTEVFKIDANGTIRAKKVRVCITSGCDYVFDDNYNLRSIAELDIYIKKNKHLPDIPPAVEMESANGYDMALLGTQLLKQVEEQTLYIIALKKEIDEMKNELNLLKK